MFLNEDEELLLGSLVKWIRASGESRRDWERRLAEVPPGSSDRGLIVEAIEIAFRSEGTA